MVILPFLLGPVLHTVDLAQAAVPTTTAAPAATVGATVPWTTYKAEFGTTTGEKLTSRVYGEIANEALYHTCIKLTATNQYITWKVRNPANAIVIRSCVPDAPKGGGQDYTLTVAVNNAARQKITLSSRHSWLYGKDANGNDDTPGTGTPHAYFDEARALLTGPPLKTGDTITLYKQAADTAPWYVIDLIDLELVAPPPSKPEDCLAITDFGAVANDGKDDTAGFKACMEKARAEGKAVWVPAGSFHQMEPIVLDKIKVRGAGPWHTLISSLGPHKPNYFPGNVGFRFEGNDAEVFGFTIDGSVTTRSDNAIQHGLTGSGQNLRAEDLWVRHTGTGGWLGDCSKVVIRRCRFRDTYADGFNINNHAEDALIEENHCRGNGDDGLAVFAASSKSGAKGTCRNITLKNNTMEGQRWGQGMGIYGGDNIIVDRNLVVSANRCAGIIVSTGFESWPGNGISLTGNVITDSGGTAYDQRYASLYLFVPGKDLAGIQVKGNVIRDAPFNAIDITGVPGASAGSLEATLADNTIESPGGAGIHITDTVRGKLTLKSNKITGQRGKPKLLNASKPDLLDLKSDLK